MVAARLGMDKRCLKPGCPVGTQAQDLTGRSSWALEGGLCLARLFHSGNLGHSVDSEPQQHLGTPGSKGGWVHLFESLGLQQPADTPGKAVAATGPSTWIPASRVGGPMGILAAGFAWLSSPGKVGI